MPSRPATPDGQLDAHVDSPRFHYHLGMAYAKGGQATLARQQLQQALKLNHSSDAEDARKQLAELKSGKTS